MNNTSTIERPKPRKPRKAKPGQVRVSGAPVMRSVADIIPSPENDTLYRPVLSTDPDIIALAESIKTNGLREPLVITLDDYVLSGHRRLCAAKLAGLSELPCRVENIRRTDDIDRFTALLREYNRQRTKSLDEVLREELVSTNPASAHRDLIAYREEQATVQPETMTIHGQMRRSPISKAKEPLLNAIQQVLERMRPYWPISIRKVHYELLSDPPLKHASKPGSIYRNDLASYKAADELITRARLEYVIPFNAIADETRPVTIWDVHREPSTFIRKDIDQFLKGYARDLQQSQPNHLEIVCEKSAMASVLRPVASEYCLPMTLGRGYASLPPRHEMAKRFRKSGKQHLVLLLLSDHDPDGQEIAESFTRSMRDDFHIWGVEAIRVALTPEQVEEYDLPPQMTAKESSAQYTKFVRRFGEDVFELDALDPDDMQEILRESIRGVMDIDAYNHELEQEEKDAAFLQAAQNAAREALKGLDLSQPPEADE